MDAIALTRNALVRIVFATALVRMSHAAIGGLVNLASWPAMQSIQEHANWFVVPAATLANILSVGLVLLGLHVARSRAEASPASPWARSLEFLDVARFVALVYLAGIIVWFIGHEGRAFVEFPIGNATHIDMFSPRARFAFEVLFPAFGGIILLVIVPRLLHDDGPPHSA